MSHAQKPFKRMIFINLAVADIEASKAFYAALGFAFEPKYTAEHGAGLIIEPDSIYVMLLSKQFFGTFSRRKICDTTTHNEALLCLSAETREDVDIMVAAAIASGGAATGIPAQDHGFMYGSSFYDPDGHHWEVAWMDSAPPEAVSN